MSKSFDFEVVRRRKLDERNAAKEKAAALNPYEHLPIEALRTGGSWVTERVLNDLNECIKPFCDKEQRTAEQR